MSIYEILNDTIYNSGDDLCLCGMKLISFADVALKEKNRDTIVRHFYKRLLEFAGPYYAFGNNDHYEIFEGTIAVLLFLLVCLPKQQSPVKTLKAIKVFGEHILDIYIKPSSIQINKKKVEQIMFYLDKNYNFSGKVFKDKKAMFLILNNSHIKYNSECLIGLDQEGKVNLHLFLYHMNPYNPEMPMPETVLFHELGHAVHARLTGGISPVPIKVLDFLEELCFPRIKSLNESQQCEVFADIISTGMIYKSPFSKYDPFPQILENDKKTFSLLFEKIINSL